MVGCKASNNLVQLIDFELYLKHDIRWNLETHLSKMNWKKTNLLFFAFYMFEILSHIFI
jgi:hypothetical protein